MTRSSRKEFVLEDPHAFGEETRYRGYVNGTGLGLIDAAGPTERKALERARQRWRIVWLGVECPGLVTLPGSESPNAGQIALNGHRFALWRQLGPAERMVCWILLNPSTADATEDDATLRRCCDYARRWGFGWLTIGNLWSYRATQPAELRQWIDRHAADERDRYGVIAGNDRYVLAMARRAELVVCGWGNHGNLHNRAGDMLRLLREAKIEPHALGLTGRGQPSHPVRLAAALKPRLLAELLSADGNPATGRVAEQEAACNA